MKFVRLSKPLILQHAVAAVAVWHLMAPVPAYAQAASSDTVSTTTSDAQTASADSQTLGTPELPIATGASTRSWLNKQTSRQDVSPHRQELSGPAMTRTYKRYLDSFTRPIPDNFESGMPAFSKR